MEDLFNKIQENLFKNIPDIKILKDLFIDTYRWSCRLNPLLQMEQTYLLSSLWVSLCFAKALEEPNILPHCSHFISGLDPGSGLGLPFCLAIWDFLSDSSRADGAGLSLSLLIDGESDGLVSSMLDGGGEGFMLCWGM